MSNIIDFKNKDSLTLSGTEVKPWKCKHSQVKVDELRRLIECKQCGQFIEPYDYIYMLAKRDAVLRTNARCLTDDVKGLTAEVAELKRIKSNLRSQIRRANKS